MKKNYQKPQSLEIMLLPSMAVLNTVGVGSPVNGTVFSPIPTE